MSVHLRGIQIELENKLGLLDSLKSKGLNEDHDYEAGEDTTFNNGTMDKDFWTSEVELLKSDINDLFDSFEKEMDYIKCDSFISSDRYETLIQALKHDYMNICRYIDSRRKKLNLFTRNTKSKFQSLNIEETEDSFERSKLFAEKKSLQDSILQLSSIVEQAQLSTKSLIAQNQTIKNVLERTRSLRKKSINRILSVINSITSLQTRQNFTLVFVFILLILLTLYIKLS
ncbi:hypothetical protein FG386_002545 [Cryptosporidium ryanae]|uniref:uncharacterized protein n=1 Tax=Cryptosporidium ryanae TaxID=515981 RepID=UPI00351AA151|nr:hypothetical protein FG386_002545 [Cryptosporidium ryanae]